jgi:hypothetical protein
MILKIACALGLLMATSLPHAGSATGATIFADDFSSPASGWEVSGDANYKDGAYDILASDPSVLIWAVARQPAVSNVHVEVTARNVRSVADASFGIICNYRDENNFTLLGAGSDGHYAIIKFEDNRPVYLTSQKAEWPLSERIKLNADHYRLGADCGSDALTLYVDGVSVATVKGASAGAGDVGLFAMANVNPQAEAKFDDFAESKLK